MNIIHCKVNLWRCYFPVSQQSAIVQRSAGLSTMNDSPPSPTSKCSNVPAESVVAPHKRWF